MTGTLAADVWVSLAAAAGLALIHQALVGARHRGGEVSAFLFGVRVLLVLVLARVIHWTTDSVLAGGLTLVAAAVVPLAVLRLAEHTRRRHAPKRLKLAILGVAVGFGLLGLVPMGESLHGVRMAALLAAQTASLVAIAWFVFARCAHDPSDAMATATRRTLDWLAVAFLVAPPLLATDYRFGPLADTPVRMGGLAILVLCWLGATLPRAPVGRREAIVSLALFTATAGVASWAIATTVGMGAADTLRTAVLALAIGMVAAIAIELRRARMDAVRDTLVDAFTDADVADADAFLDAIERRVGAMGGTLWREQDLAALDAQALTQAFTPDRLRSHDDAHTTHDTPWAREHLDFLRTTGGVSHLALLRAQPLAIVGLTPPDPLSAPALERDLRGALRLAHLLDRTQP